jgi:hypothetical protein
MNLLLDSHTLLRALHAPERLRPEAREAIRDAERAVYFSGATGTASTEWDNAGARWPGPGTRRRL